jgi:GDP-D-mannose dehydratase
MAEPLLDKGYELRGIKRRSSVFKTDQFVFTLGLLYDPIKDHGFFHFREWH